MYKLSKCRGAWLHRYDIRRVFRDCVEEVCKICHARVYFPTRDGRSNNYNYLSHHIRQALQPRHPIYAHEYGRS